MAPMKTVEESERSRYELDDVSPICWGSMTLSKFLLIFFVIFWIAVVIDSLFSYIHFSIRLLSLTIVFFGACSSLFRSYIMTNWGMGLLVMHMAILLYRVFILITLYTSFANMTDEEIMFATNLQFSLFTYSRSAIEAITAISIVDSILFFLASCMGIFYMARYSSWLFETEKHVATVYPRVTPATLYGRRPTAKASSNQHLKEKEQDSPMKIIE